MGELGRLLCGASAAAILAALVLAGAQVKAADSAANVAAVAPNGESNDVEEIVVTARRQSESLSRVPVSVSAFDHKTLEERVVTREQDLAELVPGLTVKDGQNANQLSFSMRGQTLDPFSGASPAVLTYLNEVPFSGGNSATSFFDFSSVQVLKGPQGTLFGRNASGGAVLYSSTQPGDSFGGYLTVRGGERDMRQVQGAVDIPIIAGKLKARIAGDYVASNGYITNIRDGSTLGDVDNKSVRVTLVATPLDGLKNVTVVQYSKLGGTEANGELFSYHHSGETNNGFKLTTTFDDLYGGHPFSPPTLGNGPPGPGTWPGATAGYLAWQQQHPYQIWLRYDLPHYARSRFASNTTTYDVTPDLTIKNIISVSDAFARTPGILSGSPFGAIDLNNGVTPGGETFDSDRWSEELQLQGKAFQQSLKYIFGVFASSVIEADYIPVIVGPELTPPAANIAYKYTNHDRSKAVYAQGTYDLSKILTGLSVTAGGRYTWENVSLRPNPGNIFTFDEQHAAEEAPSWTFGVEYQVNPDNLVYFAHRGSWRAGNFNGTTIPFDNLNYFKNEYTHDFEVGYKFKGEIFDKAARLNLAAFEQIVSNAQHAVYAIVGGNPAGFTINVPQATIRGVELDGDIKATSWLRLGIAAAYTHAAYTKGEVSIFGQVVPFDSYPDTPRVSGSVNATVTLPTPESWGAMTVRADAFSQTSTYFASNSGSIDPRVRLPGYTTVNMRYGWEGIMGSNASLGVYVKNLLDRFYFQSGYVEGASGGFNTAIVGAPRTFGAELNYKF
jgi:iron complex outermembrane receptor protein